MKFGVQRVRKTLTMTFLFLNNSFEQHFDSKDCHSENKVKISAVKPNHQSVLRNCDLTLRLQEQVLITGKEPL